MNIPESLVGSRARAQETARAIRPLRKRLGELARTDVEAAILDHDARAAESMFAEEAAEAARFGGFRGGLRRGGAAVQKVQPPPVDVAVLDQVSTSFGYALANWWVNNLDRDVQTGVDVALGADLLPVEAADHWLETQTTLLASYPFEPKSGAQAVVSAFAAFAEEVPAEGLDLPLGVRLERSPAGFVARRAAPPNSRS